MSLKALFSLVRIIARPSRPKGPVVHKAQPVQTPAPVRSVRHSRSFDPGTAQGVPRPHVIKGRARIVDGDTLVIRKTRIRLFGIDAPELNHPYGVKAKWALVDLCQGHDIRAEVTETDAHGRTVARCYLEDGRDLSAEMVKAGLAIDWARFSGGVYRSLEVPDARRKMWLADARQNGRMFVWEKFEARQRAQQAKNRS